MPRPREDDVLQKHTLQLFSGDFQRLQDLYPEVGASAVIRRLVRKHINDNTSTPINIPLNEEIDL